MNAKMLTLAIAGGVAAANCVFAQTTSLTIEAYIDGRSHAIIEDQTIRWQHLEYDRPGRWNGATHPTYLTVHQGDIEVLPRFAWQPLWIGNGNNSEPISLGKAPFGSECDPAELIRVQVRGSAQIVQQPLRTNGLATIVEFNDNMPLGAAWYTVRIEWDIPACPADFNCDEQVNSQDFFAFLAAFFAEGTAADVNGDDVTNSQDLFDYLGMFFAGCT